MAESLREAEMIAMIVLVKNHNYDVITTQAGSGRAVTSYKF